MKKLLNIITKGKYKIFKKVLIATILLYAISEIAFVIIINKYSNIDMGISSYLSMSSFLLWALIAEVIYYFVKISPIKKSIQLSTADGSLKYISEITSENYESNGRIAFSDHFFYDLKYNFFIAYESIAWIYNKKGGLIVRSIDGKKFTSSLDNDNFHSLINSNPHILVGDGMNHYKIYTAMVNDFRSGVNLSAGTTNFDITNAVNSFWKLLSSKNSSKTLYAVGFTCEALFFIGLIIVAAMQSHVNRIPAWTFPVWVSLLYFGLFFLWVAHKVEAYELVKPSRSKTPSKVNNFIDGEFIQRLFVVKNEARTFIALDKRNGRAMKIKEHPVRYNNSYKYEVTDISYQDVRNYAKENNADKDYKNLSSVTWQTFIEPEPPKEIKTKKCKSCKKDFPELEIDENGYCPYCAENWWKS